MLLPLAQCFVDDPALCDVTLPAQGGVQCTVEMGFKGKTLLRGADGQLVLLPSAGQGQV